MEMEQIPHREFYTLFQELDEEKKETFEYPGVLSNNLLGHA